MNRRLNEEPDNQIKTVDGDSDLTGIQPNDLVSMRLEGATARGRRILLPAKLVVIAEGQPLSEAQDGATTMVGGDQAVKLGGEVIAHTGLVEPE